MRPFLPQALRTSPLRGGARAAHGGTNSVTDMAGGIAYAVVSGRGEAVRAAKTTRVAVDALRNRVVGICAWRLSATRNLGYLIS